MSSWLKLYRKLAETDLWLAEPFTKGQAWADLLMLARFQDGFVRIRGIKVEVKRGQVAWSEVELAKRWQWSRGKVRRFLGEMEMEQQIEQQKNNITTLISIINFERYQGNGTADSTANRTADGTANGTAEPPQPKIGGDCRSPKNGKNGKNVKPYTDEFLKFWQTYPKKVGKAAAFKAWKSKNGTRPPVNELIKKIEQQKQSTQWNRDGGQYIPNPATWLNQERWEDEIEGVSQHPQQPSYQELTDEDLQ